MEYLLEDFVKHIKRACIWAVESCGRFFLIYLLFLFSESGSPTNGNLSSFDQTLFFTIFFKTGTGNHMDLPLCSHKEIKAPFVL